MTFQCFAFRFTFRALDPVRFQAGAAANAFRGAFGQIFLRLAGQAAYARLFQPVNEEGPSGLKDAPRPFVIRAAALDGKTCRAGETFAIDVHLFDVRTPALEHFVHAFQELAREGIGAGRGRILLAQVRTLDAGRSPCAVIYEDRQPLLQPSGDPLSVLLDGPQSTGPGFVTIRFTTPTELKGDGGILRDAPFAVVFARARDRIATLSALYGDGPLAIDFGGMGERAGRVETASANLRWESHSRKSARTGQVHPLGGFVGEVRYRGALAEFLPYLEAAYWTGVGRQTVWGKGAVEIVPSSMTL